jgi:hypothetical protein
VPAVNATAGDSGLKRLPLMSTPGSAGVNSSDVIVTSVSRSTIEIVIELWRPSAPLSNAPRRVTSMSFSTSKSMPTGTPSVSEPTTPGGTTYAM